MARAGAIRGLIGSSPPRWLGQLAFAFALGLGLPGSAGAQDRLFGEGRIDAIFARSSAVQAAAGLGFSAGTYTRVVLLAGAGRTLGSHGRVTGRAEVVTRFLLDPFAASRFGAYGLAGVGVFVVDEVAEPRIIAGLGLEGPIHRGRAVAAELSLSGGIRVGLAIRSARPRRR